MEPIWAQIGYDLEPEKVILEPPGVQFAESGTDLLEFGGQITFLEPSELCWDPNKVQGPDLEPTWAQNGTRFGAKWLMAPIWRPRARFLDPFWTRLAMDTHWALTGHSLDTHCQNLQNIAFLELKMVQYPSKSRHLHQSADMRLEPAGCSGLRVGPPKLAPKNCEKSVGNLARF